MLTREIVSFVLSLVACGVAIGQDSPMFHLPCRGALFILGVPMGIFMR